MRVDYALERSRAGSKIERCQGLVPWRLRLAAIRVPRACPVASQVCCYWLVLDAMGPGCHRLVLDATGLSRGVSGLLLLACPGCHGLVAWRLRFAAIGLPWMPRACPVESQACC